MKFALKLTYELPANQTDAAEVMASLGDAGCTDALVGFGVAGQVCVEFVREAHSAEAAILNTIADVSRALPGAKLVEAEPDQFGPFDMAVLAAQVRTPLGKESK
jgi:hypothetical protein